MGRVKPSHSIFTMAAFSLLFDATKLLASLQKAPIQVSKELRLEMKKSMRDVQVDAQTHHRFKKQKGMLEKAITTNVSADGLTGEVLIDPGEASYGGYVHEGTRPHVIKPKSGGKGMFFVKGGSGFYVPPSPSGSYKDESGVFHIGKGYVNHPGTRPDQFVYQAMARMKSSILARMQGAVARAYKIAGFK